MRLSMVFRSFLHNYVGIATPNIGGILKKIMELIGIGEQKMGEKCIFMVHGLCPRFILWITQL